MRKSIATITGLALVIGVALVGGSRMATAQGGGTIEAEVKYNGAPVIEKLKVNKDVEKCGNEAAVEKIVVGGNKGLANAVVSVPEAKGAPTAKKITVDQHGCKFVPHVMVRSAAGGAAVEPAFRDASRRSSLHARGDATSGACGSAR